MTRHIGIVGCSAEGAALCYRTICSEGAALLGPHAHPEVTLHTLPLANYAHHLDRGDLEGVSDLMLTSARKLAACGADFLICPDNTIHAALPRVLPRSPLPWLSISEVVEAEAASRGFRCLGLLGTRWLVGSDVYPATHRRPNDADRDEVHRIIMEELVYGILNAGSILRLREIVRRFVDCDAVILGCTELPLVLGDEGSPLPTLDSTRLLARAALKRATDGHGERTAG
jgi:aspartate racemase